MTTNQKESCAFFTNLSKRESLRYEETAWSCQTSVCAVCPTIFVHIAAYRDPELSKTIQSCLLQADRPEQLSFGICHQFDSRTKGILRPWVSDPRFTVEEMPWESGKGVGYARSRCTQMYRNQDFVLQIDSHMRFAPHWDTVVIKEWLKTTQILPVNDSTTRSDCLKNQKASTVVLGDSPHFKTNVGLQEAFQTKGGRDHAHFSYCGLEREQSHPALVDLEGRHHNPIHVKDLTKIYKTLLSEYPAAYYYETSVNSCDTRSQLLVSGTEKCLPTDEEDKRKDDLGFEVYDSHTPSVLIVDRFHHQFVPTFKSTPIITSARSSGVPLVHNSDNNESYHKPERPSREDLMATSDCHQHACATLVAARFVAGGFIFGPGSICTTVPYEEKVCFTGEEILYSYRLFQAGYRVYAPSCPITWHLYDRPAAIRFWDVQSNYAELLNQSLVTLWHAFIWPKQLYLFLNSFSLKDEANELLQREITNARRDDALNHDIVSETRIEQKIQNSLKSLLEFEDFVGLDFQHAILHPQALLSDVTLPLASSTSPFDLHALSVNGGCSNDKDEHYPEKCAPLRPSSDAECPPTTSACQIIDSNCPICFRLSAAFPQMLVSRITKPQNHAESPSCDGGDWKIGQSWETIPLKCFTKWILTHAPLNWRVHHYAKPKQWNTLRVELSPWDIINRDVEWLKLQANKNWQDQTPIQASSDGPSSDYKFWFIGFMSASDQEIFRYDLQPMIGKGEQQNLWLTSPLLWFSRQKDNLVEKKAKENNPNIDSSLSTSRELAFVLDSSSRGGRDRTTPSLRYEEWAWSRPPLDSTQELIHNNNDNCLIPPQTVEVCVEAWLSKDEIPTQVIVWSYSASLGWMSKTHIPYVFSP